MIQNLLLKSYNHLFITCMDQYDTDINFEKLPLQFNYKFVSTSPDSKDIMQLNEW